MKDQIKHELSRLGSHSLVPIVSSLSDCMRRVISGISSVDSEQHGMSNFFRLFMLSSADDISWNGP